MNSEKLYVWLQAFNIFISLVYICIFSDYLGIKETYKHPILCDILFKLFALGIKIGEYFIIKLFAIILIFIFGLDTDYRLKIVLFSYMFITLKDVFSGIYKYAKECHNQAQL